MNISKMSHRVLIITILTVLSWSVSKAQTDSIGQIDKVHLKDGTVLEGKVKIIKTDLVEFIERETNLVYEFRKSEIKVILLSSGKSISFSDETNKTNEQPQQTSQPYVVEKEDGAPVGLIILASVGAVLLVLLLIGAAAQ
ncbi:MAG: hypothetical protein FD143_3154 [Ignavibacteria bacterium]|nr:MAG: hypothetical protein FD143_3154 [Ignavibacteria bacterium]